MSITSVFNIKQEQVVFSVITEQEKLSISEEIICGRELKFNYINGDKLINLLDEKKIPKENLIELTYLDILKYNLDKIINQLAEYFPNIKIIKFINSPCATECKIKQEKFTYKYNLYIVMAKNDIIYEYGFDFFLNLSDIPENKYSHSKILLDNYQYFISEDVQTNEDVKRYLNENLFKMMTAICALKNDEHQLAEIMFVKSNQENKISKQILKELEYFLRVINWKKSDSINLENLFDECMFTDNQTEKTITYKKFKKILSLICEKDDIKYDIENETIRFDIFEEIIMNINKYFESSTISQYKLVYKKAMKMLMDSLKIIIEMVKEINMKKTFTPDYINNLIKFHLNEYKDQNVISKIYYEKINKKKILFEDMFNEITKYCNKNKHNEDKLDKIKNDFDLLYDDLFNV